MAALTIALILRGGSARDQNVSLREAQSIYDALDRNLYTAMLVSITRDGKWWLHDNPKTSLFDVDSSRAQITFLPGGGGKALIHRCSERDRVCHVDVVFPYMPDGVFEGFLEAAKVPFIGSRGPASAICMDKQILKRILRDAGLPIARSRVLLAREKVSFQLAQESLCCHSLFVKPACLYESIGVSKVTCKSEFQTAVDLAFSYGSKVVIEEYVEGREFECAVLQDIDDSRRLFCSWPGEIMPTEQHAFFTYQAKRDGKGITRARAEIGDVVAKQLQALSREAFNVIGCEGLARVDFLMRTNGELLINEVTTIPSLRPTSMFSQMMEESGMPYETLLQRLVQGAIERSRRARPGL